VWNRTTVAHKDLVGPTEHLAIERHCDDLAVTTGAPRMAAVRRAGVTEGTARVAVLTVVAGLRT
jgi:hypothetical protein